MADMRYAVLLVVASMILGTAFAAEAQVWVQVTGGAFVITPAELNRVQGSLKSRVTAAAKAQRLKLPPWRQFLLQYRSTYIKGLRVIEIQGSCQRKPHIDIRKEFVGDNITDGGTCFFTVIYVVNSAHYSTVAFHGHA